MKVELTDTLFKNAVCLDGSPPIYYVSKGHSTKKWMVWLEVVPHGIDAAMRDELFTLELKGFLAGQLGSSPFIHTHARPRVFGCYQCPGRRLVREDT